MPGEERVGERGPLCRAQQHEEARAPGGRVGEGRVVQREHELQHVAAIEEGVIEARAQPLLVLGLGLELGFG